MATVTYDDRSILVDGERLCLVSGSLHYFRIPSGLWADRLLKAKRAGLNCISTYIPWNFHEPVEGQWQLTGDHDVVEFVRLAEKLGLYVILRPGPYICAEWDFGGLPGWLTAKTGMNYRTSGAAFTHYYDKFFRQLLPRLAECQVTRGGNIILIQNENEYFMTTMPDRLNYLTFINQLFRRSGFDIPIINCNNFTDPPVPENIECVNTYIDVIEQLKRMRLRRPDAPLLVTEFHNGWFDHWGDKHQTRDAHEVARRALEIVGCGAQYNYYMWHGGTNFGFWGSRLAFDHDAYVTSSYDYDAPLAEGGVLTEKYYLTRLVNMLANHMGKVLASCEMEEPGVTAHDSTTVLNMYGPAGRWAVITNNGRKDITTADISLPEGRHLQVSLEPLGATLVPVDVRLSPTLTLDYCNLMPLGLFGQKILVLHGPGGFPGRISLNGAELLIPVPKDNQPQLHEHQGMTIVVMNSQLAQRTWLVEETLVIGADHVGQTLEDVKPPRGAKQYALLPLEGKISYRKVKTEAQKKPSSPRLGSWIRRRVCTEPVAKDLPWTKIDRPTDADRQGVHYGYAWYQIRIPADRIRKRYLFFPDCQDRAILYLNGQRLGIWGRGPDAVRKPIPANFKRGENRLTLLVDNLGRVNSGSRLGELKGLFGHVYDAKLLRTEKFKIKPQEVFSKRAIPRQFVHLIPTLEKQPIISAELDIPMTKVAPVHLSFTHLPHHAAVFCNDRFVGFFENAGENYGDVTLAAELKKGKNIIKLLLWGDVSAKAMDNVRFHSLTENLTHKAQWNWRPWTLPSEEGLIVGKDRPAWYVAKFKYTPQPMPLFLRILGAKKGQIFLNGRNLGRFWNLEPQHRHYLPECWLTDHYELMIFEEYGMIPSGSRLEFCRRGPYGE